MKNLDSSTTKYAMVFWYEVFNLKCEEIFVSNLIVSNYALRSLK